MKPMLSAQLNYTQADLTMEEMETLLEAVKASEGFTHYSLEELKKLQKKGNVLVLRSAGKLCGVSAYEFVDKEWAEINMIIILPEFRGKGYGKKLWKAVVGKLTQYNIFTWAFNPVTQKILAPMSGFKRKRFWRLPLTVQFFLAFQRFTWDKFIGFLKKTNIKLKDLQFFIRPKSLVN